MVTRSVEGNVVVWKHEELYVLGVFGRMRDYLERINFESTKNVEYSKVKSETNRDFLAGFHFNPGIDLTVVRRENAESSVVVVGLQKDKSKALLEEVVENIHLVPYAPPSDFLPVSDPDALARILLYQNIGIVVKKLGCSLESAFGIASYGNFLNRYKGCSEEESLDRAVKKFLISKDSS